MNDNESNKSAAEKEEIAEKLFRLMRLMHRRNHRIGGEFFADGIQRGQGRILAMLQMKPDMTQKELSFLLNIRNQSLGELLAKLEKKGFIVRTPSDEDKRMMKVSLTEKGAEAAKRAQNKNYEILKIFEKLSDEEIRIFGAILDKLIAELGEAQGDEDIESDTAAAMRKVGKFFKDPFVKIFKNGFGFDNEGDDDEDNDDNDDGGEKIIDIENDDGTVVHIEKTVGDDGKKIKKIKIKKKIIEKNDGNGGRRIIVNGVVIDPENAAEGLVFDIDDDEEDGEDI